MIISYLKAAPGHALRCSVRSQPRFSALILLIDVRLRVGDMIGTLVPQQEPSWQMLRKVGDRLPNPLQAAESASVPSRNSHQITSESGTPNIRRMDPAKTASKGISASEGIESSKPVCEDN